MFTVGNSEFFSNKNRPFRFLSGNAGIVAVAIISPFENFSLTNAKKTK
jgi:hypothetical protein